MLSNCTVENVIKDIQVFNNLNFPFGLASEADFF